MHPSEYAIDVAQKTALRPLSLKSFKFKYFMFVISCVLRHSSQVTAKGAGACVRQFWGAARAGLILRSRSNCVT
ncbi:MAG: hypothetical protein WCE24_10860, partial [Pseudolabrys sp.]